MATPAQVLKDPNFLGLPTEERRKVLSTIDPNFGGLPKAEQDKVLMPPTPTPPGPPPGPRKRNEGASKPAHQETLQEGLSKEGMIARPVLQTLFTPVEGAQRVKAGFSEMATEPTARGKARGVHDVISGGLDLASPYIAEGVVTAPIRTFLALAAGGATQQTIEKVGEYFGVPEEYMAVIGDIAGLEVGGRIAKGTPKIKETISDTSQRVMAGVPRAKAIAGGAYRGAKAGATAPATLKIKGFPVQLPVNATVAGAGLGLEIGSHVPLPGAGIAGAVIGGAAPAVRGAIRGAREVYRPTPPPTALETSREAYEANKGRVGKVARQYTPGGATPPGGPGYPQAKVTIEPETKEPWSPVRGKPSTTPPSSGPNPGTDYAAAVPPRIGTSPPVETPPEPWKPVRGKPSRGGSSGPNPGSDFGPARSASRPRSAGIAKEAPPSEAEGEESPAKGPTSGYTVLPPIRYENEVNLKVMKARDAIVDKLASRRDAGELAAKPKEWWRANYKKLGLKTPPSEETLSAFLERLGWKTPPPPR